MIADTTACVRWVGPNPLPDSKVGHSGERGPPVGPWRYVVVRHEGKMFGPFETRHAAAGWIASVKPTVNDYAVVPARDGQIPHTDVIPVE